MGKKLAIKGHTTRAKEVVEIFQMLGGCKCGYEGHGENYYYYINRHGNIEGSVHPTDFDEYIVFTLEEFIDKFPYKIGDKVYWTYSRDSEQPIYTIDKMIWNGKGIVYQIVTHGCTSCWWRADELKPIGYCTMPNQGSNDTKKIAWFHFWDNDFADKVELDLTNRELIQENGKWFVVKKKPAYPKTYEECCETLKVVNSGMPCVMASHLGHAISNLAKLIIVRDAYWSIYSDNLGLSNTWQPDWTNTRENKYCIYCVANELKKQPTLELQHLLAFPTRAICDAFFKDFRTLIESCKEFL